MAERVRVSPALLTWAVRRANLTDEVIARRFPDLSKWIADDFGPTLKQLENFASATHAPFGTFFMNEPPTEAIPIPDFRTSTNSRVSGPSADLLDTIYICQMRQEWYRTFAISREYDQLPFVGAVEPGGPVDQTASDIRSALSFGLEGRSQVGTWEQSRLDLIAAIEDIGILVMVSGIVGNNTHRVLDPAEFRGFALSDEFAPVIFVNAADTQAAQIFTLIHELAHIWSGESALSDVPVAKSGANEHELWCNAVAAEVLIPLQSLLAEFRGIATPEEVSRLAKFYKVSTLVVIKRIFDAGRLGWDEYRTMYEGERARVIALAEDKRKAGGGGNYYFTQPRRLSPQFTRAVITDTLEGGTLHRDAYELLGTRKHETFVKLGEQVGVF
ncbi:MAG: ImmA/IrrE family metallo-endopeptidase [Microbacteriaceae bacterium]|nr:ImmA/IrrE family metallo-endopeptidase [Microbacteriaceae bacterium]